MIKINGLLVAKPKKRILQKTTNWSHYINKVDFEITWYIEYNTCNKIPRLCNDFQIACHSVNWVAMCQQYLFLRLQSSEVGEGMQSNGNSLKFSLIWVI